MIFHHGAVFAATRWTNVYATGDFVGGPIDAALGKAVREDPFDRQVGPWTSVPFLSHTQYWTKPNGAARIRQILDAAISGREPETSGGGFGTESTEPTDDRRD